MKNSSNKNNNDDDDKTQIHLEKKLYFLNVTVGQWFWTGVP